MLAPRNRFKPSSKIFLLTVPRRYFFCGSFVLSIVKTMAKIRKRYNKVPHLAQDTKWESSKVQLASPTRFMSCVCHFLCLSCFRICSLLHCGHQLGKVDLLALVSDVLLCFVTFPCGILGQVWYLIVLIPDLCHLSYLDILSRMDQQTCWAEFDLINFSFAHQSYLSYVIVKKK